MDTKNLNETESGRMRIGQNGESYITVEVINEAEQRSETLEFQIDTGFNGFLQLDSATVAKLSLSIVGNRFARGFDGNIKKVGVVQSKIKILGLEGVGIPVQVVENGSLLLGTQFFKAAKITLVANYRDNTFHITNDQETQRKVTEGLTKRAR